MQKRTNKAFKKIYGQLLPNDIFCCLSLTNYIFLLKRYFIKNEVIKRFLVDFFINMSSNIDKIINC